jgi:tRNA-2-methylthio-N6-dimethylallyladenosine synthase
MRELAGGLPGAADAALTGRCGPPTYTGDVARKFLIRTFGCQMNESDSERLAGLMIADGLEQTEDLEDADVVVFNTCCIRENADNKLYGQLGRLKELHDRKPDMQIAVGGCLAQKDRDIVRKKAGHVDVVFGTHNLARAPELLRMAQETGPVVEVLDRPADGQDPFEVSALSSVREVPYASWMTIQTGCDNSCAFCIVPSVRGGEVSRPFDNLVADAEALAGIGVTELTLLGQNVNSYGRDITRRKPLFAELLRAIGSVEGIQRIRYTSPHPKDLRPETIAAMAEVPEVCNHLHLPLQSGNDRVLSAMRRGYTAERYLEKLESARAGIEDLAVTTDIIVGFPGETDAEFEQTLEVAATACYDSAYTFIFSPRAGTRAAEMTETFVPEEVIAERFERLHAVTQRSALLKHEARIGLTEEVLVEGPSKRNPAMITGKTTQGKLIHFEPGSDGGRQASAPPMGSYARVKVTSAAPHHLRGELVDVVRAPAHKVRIPLSVSVRGESPVNETADGPPQVASLEGIAVG